jgi:hypothetical protein
MKIEITRDRAMPWARALVVGPRTALTVTTHHLVNKHSRRVRGRGGVVGFAWVAGP